MASKITVLLTVILGNIYIILKASNSYIWEDYKSISYSGGIYIDRVKNKGSK